jgi:UDP-N-acetyl-D-mannosaminuronic acid dehydrogenase
MSKKQEKLVVVGGCGHVGLPLGIVLASHADYNVSLLDIDVEKVRLVNSGKLPFREEGAEELLSQLCGGNLHATDDYGCLQDAEIVITVVGTPVDRHLNPTAHELHRSIDRLLQQMHDGALLILRSTVYPGVTKLVYDRVRNRGRKIQVAFCPERIAEGKAIEELVKLPQIVAAFEPEAMRRATELFLKLSPTVIELEPLEAELAKLFTNSWRYLNFAVSNQFYMLAESYGLDFYRIYEAVTRDYPRMRSFARPGFAAGPCLLKDTLQLSTFANNNFFLGHAAMLVNEGLPNFIVGQLRHEGLAGRTVAILGMAFKAESDDIRDSLSFKLRKLLESEGVEVLCTDPYVQEASFVSLKEALEADIIILGAPHSVYREVRFSQGKRVIDVWNFWPARATATIHEQVVAAAR